MHGRLWIILAWIALSAPVGADEGCLVSFDSARLDACTGEVSVVDEVLRPLAEAEAFAHATVRVVKFDGPVGRAQRVALEALGAEILDYAPFHAYVVRMSPEHDRQARSIDGVIWTGPFLPAWKVGRNLARRMDGGQRTAGNFPDRLQVAMQPGTAAAEGRALAGNVPGVDHVFTESGPDRQRLVLAFEPARLAEVVTALAAEDAVAAVNLRWPVTVRNSQAGWLHQSGTLDVTPVFDQGIFGCGEVIGVLDTGLRESHCSFEDADYGEPVFDACAAGTDCDAIDPNFDHRKIGAYYKWSGNPGGPGDDSGHGTHVTGSAAGNLPDDAVDCDSYTTPGGMTNLDGTAPGAKLISQEAGPGLEYLNVLGGTIYHAAEVAYANGARIHNNSWGSNCRDAGGQCIPGCQVEYRQGTRDADAAVWDFPELALFVAAGNSGTGCGPGADVGAAGNAKNVFSIGSNVRGEHGNEVSSFSSRGPASDRRTKPDILAQGGGETLETAIHSASANSACGVAAASGTSMASPTAAGLAALIRAYLARGFYPMGEEVPSLSITNPSAALIKAMMINGARQIDGSGSGSLPAPNTDQGWGRVHLDDVLYFEGDARRLWFMDADEGLDTGTVDEHFVQVGDGEPLKLTLVWHDFPAAVNADPHIVNILRLEVETPNGEVWTQKLPVDGGLDDPDPFQGTGEANHDERNTVHQVRLDEPQPGTYTIRVRGIQVAQGDQQPYALVATGALSAVADPDFALRAVPGERDICAGDPAAFDVEVQSIQDFEDPVSLAVTGGLPDGASTGFSDNPVVPAHPAVESTLSIADTETAATGTYAVEITGASDGPEFPQRDHSVAAALRVSAQSPAAGELVAPPDQAVDRPLRPQFSWTGYSDVRSYRFQLARDPDFEDIVIDEIVTGSEFTPAAELDSVSHYYWRVAGINPCGQGAFTPARTFATRELPGDCPLDSQSGTLLEADFDAGQLPSGWSADGAGPATWIISDQRDFTGGQSAYAENFDEVSDQRLTTSELDLPAQAGALRLQFRNWQHIESWPDGGCFDGGVVEISADDGNTWEALTGDQLIARPHDGEVSEVWGNPLAGETAWCGDPRDTWERYAADLDAWAGESVRLRFRLGTDSRVAREGWYVDAVTVRACGDHTVGGSVSALEGSGLVLENNGGDAISIQDNGPFRFDLPFVDGADYEVTVAEQPENPEQECTVVNGSGTISGADVDDVVVDCSTPPHPVMALDRDTIEVRVPIGGMVTEQLTITNPGAESLAWSVVEDDPDCPMPAWVDITPDTGTVEGGGEQALALVFDDAGAGDGDIDQGVVCLSGNDPDDPLQSVTLERTLVIFADGFE